jgi:hypothetical protein
MTAFTLPASRGLPTTTVKETPLAPGYSPGARIPSQSQGDRAEAATTDVSAGSNEPTALAAFVGHGVAVAP